MYPDFLRRRMMFDILFSMGWARNSRAWQNEPNEVHHGNLQEQLQGPRSVADDNQKVVGALSVVGATIVKIVSRFQYYFPDFLKKIRISVNQLGFPGIPAKFREIFTEK